jgi:hypothetical protein
MKKVKHGSAASIDFAIAPYTNALAFADDIRGGEVYAIVVFKGQMLH